MLSCYRKSKNTKKADVVFKKCLEDRPKDSLLLYNYGKFFHDQKTFPQDLLWNRIR